MAKGAVIKATLHYVDEHRDELKTRYKSFADFEKDFVIPQSLSEQLLAYGKEAGVKYNEEEYKKSLPVINLQLKALIARDIWDMSEYYKIIHQNDPVVQKALQLLENSDFGALLRKNGKS